MTTELCAYTCDACDIARRTGVTRIELCAAPFEGGTTPSAGLIRYARSLPGLRLSVMIRPRGGDFCYTDAETALMAEEIRFARACGADGVVLGVLTPDGEVDETRTAQLVREAEGMEVTFHRAFDMTRDPRQALEAVIRTGCRRVLTSGGRNTAQEGVGTLRALAAQAAGRIEIMAGSGGNPSNAPEWQGAYVERTADSYHASKRHPSVIAFSLATQSSNGINLYESYLDMKKSGDSRPFIYPDAAGEWNSDKLDIQ